MTVPQEVAVAQSGTTIATGILGAAIGAGSFVYNIIKDHGAKLQINKVAGGDGVASGNADETRFEATFVGEFSVSGVWYNHTRAYGLLLEKNRGTLPHQTTKDPEELNSIYLCTVFPYQVRWNLYKVTPKPITLSAQAKMRKAFADEQNLVYKEFYKDLEEARRKKPVISPDDYDFEGQEEDEKFVEYVEYLKNFDEIDPRISTAIKKVELGLEEIETRRAEYADQVEKSNDTSRPFYVLRNIAVQELSEHRGLRQRYWQHIAIDSTFTITSQKERPYGFTLALEWKETILGYGYPGKAGAFKITQNGPNQDDIEITHANTKAGRRFEQFMTKKKE